MPQLKWRDEDIAAALDCIRQSATIADGLELHATQTGRAIPLRSFMWSCRQRGIKPGDCTGGTAVQFARKFGDVVKGMPPPNDGPKPPPPSPAETQRVLVCPDVHVPYQHAEAWETFLAVAREWRPHVLVLLGDFADFYCVTSHPKDPARRLTFQEEVALVNRELDRVCHLNIPRVIYCEGNHETRLSRYITANAQAFHGVIDTRHLLQIDRRTGWEWVPYGQHTAIGKLSFSHDIGFAGVYAARQSVAAFGHNIIFGHTHRAQCHYESTVHGERHVGWSMGWLGDPSAIDYRHRARVMRESQHGFGVAHVLDDGTGWVHFAPIIDGRVVVDGKLIGAADGK